MKRERALSVLAQPVEALSLSYAASGPVIEGRLLHFEGKILALGGFVAAGDEAVVHELIDVNSGERNHVIKICRHPPQSRKYDEWAVPFRLESNELSRLADVELNSAQLLQVSGIWIKVQQYFAGHNTTDWGSRHTIRFLLNELSGKVPEEGLARISALRARFGPQGLLFEAEAFVHARSGEWEQAEAALKRAIATYVDARSYLSLGALLQLSGVYRELYHRFENSAATTVSLDLGDGKILKQTIFADPAAAALDDAMQDRSCFSLLEALGEEPLLVPALLALAEDFSDHLPGIAIALAERAKTVNPDITGVDEFIASIRSSQEAQGLERNPIKERTAEGHSSDIPDEVVAGLALYNAAYKPDSATAWTAKGRELAFKGLMLQGAYDNALAVAEEWSMMSDASCDGRIAKVQAFTALGRHEEATELGERLLEEFPERVEVMEALFWAHDSANAHDQALRYALMVLHSGGALARQGAFMVSRSYRRLGAFSKAEAYAKSSLGEDFSETPYVLNYVYILRDMGIRGDDDAFAREEALILRAVAACPESTDLKFCYAQSLARSGRLDDAVLVLRELLDLDHQYQPAQEFIRAIESRQD